MENRVYTMAELRAEDPALAKRVAATRAAEDAANITAAASKANAAASAAARRDAGPANQDPLAQIATMPADDLTWR